MVDVRNTKTVPFVYARNAKTVPFVLSPSSLDGERTSSIYLVVNDAGLPTPEGRKRLEQITAKSEKRLVGVVTVVTGDGFRASAVRGFLTGLHWLARRAYKVKVCSTLSECANWIAPLHSAHSFQTDASALEKLMH